MRPNALNSVLIPSLIFPDRIGFHACLGHGHGKVFTVRVWVWDRVGIGLQQELTLVADLDSRVLPWTVALSYLTAGFVFQFFCLLAFLVDSPLSSVPQPALLGAAGPVV